jgi:hypothetical protein
MSNSLRRVVQQSFTPEYLRLFIPSSIVLSTIGTAISTVLTNLIGSTTPAAVTIIIGAASIFLFSAWTISKLSNKSTPATDLAKAPPDRCPGLILLVSREEPCRKAIEYHLPNLQYCWLICSSGTEHMAKQIKADFPNVNMPKPWIINDVHDPIEFNDAIRKIYEKLPSGLTIEDVIADFTGMTANGSVGMALVSNFFPNVKFQYTPAELSSDGKQTGRSLNPIGITIV